MTFYSEEAIEKIKSLESTPRVYKDILSKEEIDILIDLEEKSNNLRMVDREDSRKTKIELQSEVLKIIGSKIEPILGYKISLGDFPAHFIKNKYPLRIHADMGKDSSLIPHKNILIPLYVKGESDTYTLLFKQRWYGQSSLFSYDGDSNTDHFFKDSSDSFIHITDAQDLLFHMKNNMGKEITYSTGTFSCTQEKIKEIEALLKQSRYSQRTNKHITSNVEFNKDHYEKYLTHQPYKDLTGLELDTAITWHPGDVIVFDRSTIHCASNFLKEGVEEKMAIAMFTVWDEDNVR